MRLGRLGTEAAGTTTCSAFGVISSQDLLQQRTKSTCQPHLQKQLQVFDLLLQFCDFSSDARELQLFHEKHPRTYIDLTTKMFRLFERVTKFSQVLA